MTNIEQVLKHNLRRLRGKRTQLEVSEACRIPFRTFQGLESGVFPRKRKYLSSLARYYGVPETSLFLDPDLPLPTPAKATDPTVEDILKVIVRQSGRPTLLLKRLLPILNRIESLNEEEFMADLESIETRRKLLASRNLGRDRNEEVG